MTSYKLVIKCGNYAVLVDLHLMAPDSSEDNVWLSDQKREEICMLLKDTVDSRVKQYLRAHKRHGQGKQTESAKANPLFMQGNDFHISAYFVKRWVNLRCIGRQQDSDLRVFPERFVICVTKLESSPPPWKENLPAGTSTYFGESAEDEKCKTSLTQQKKQDILKKIVKRTTIKKSNEIKAQPSKDTIDVYLGLLGSDSE
ncbi:protein SLX4IP isoform X2 [Pogona vitticeps]